LTHKLAAGVIVLDGNNVLLVKDDKDWGLPKGSTEPGETFMQAAIREGREETGYEIVAKEVAFVTEYISEEYGSYLQVYYVGEIIGEANEPLDSDILSVKFVPIEELREYMSFRPWVLPLERWIKERRLGYFSYNLDEVSYLI
jgi:ADP-ribose pyrophosphatase YjhB (NUDIX family)